MRLDPTGNLPYLVSNLAFMSREEILALNIQPEVFQSLIDYWGADAVLNELQGLGFEHVGLTMQADGMLAKSVDR